MAPVDLRSDTVTTPTEEMRAAAADAAVGDDVYGDDPTVNDLEATVADRLGFEAALFCPSGTMANQVAVRTHADRGEEALVERESHVYKWEVGGLAQLAGVQPRTYDAGERAVPTPEAVREGLVTADLHRPGTGLLCLENTHNSYGGVAVEPDRVAAAADAARAADVPVHLDGARLWNAAVALDEPLTAFTDPVDSVMVSLSKGLGAPVGSLLAGSGEFVARARRNRKLYGGGMRQAGVVAAPGLVAVDPATVDRLATDHENAARLAAGLDDVPGVAASDPDTNIVLVDVAGTGMPAAGFLDAVDVLGNARSETVVRFVTHRDVDADDVDRAVASVREAVSD
ncbi:MAG: low specificity L-threonine aldolase [Halobacteriaceae archaeon]